MKSDVIWDIFSCRSRYALGVVKTLTQFPSSLDLAKIQALIKFPSVHFEKQVNIKTPVAWGAGMS